MTTYSVVRRAVVAGAMVAGLGAVAMGQAAAPAYAPVKAPNGQRLVTEVTARHKEAQLVGLHLTPPDGKENVIVACNDLPRVGKPSSEGDMAVMKSGKSVIRKKEKDGVYDVQMALDDAQGKRVGMMVELVRMADVKDEAAALAAAEGLRKEIEAGLKSEAWVFEGGA